MIATVAKSHSVWTSLIWLVIAGNLGWAVAALAVGATLPVAPLGIAFAAVHAITVTTFAYLEYRGISASEPSNQTIARA